MIVICNGLVTAGGDTVFFCIRACVSRSVVDNDSTILDHDDDGKHRQKLPEIKVFHFKNFLQ